MQDNKETRIFIKINNGATGANLTLSLDSDILYIRK